METENPLFHGEISTLNAFYKLPAAGRPATRDCLFLSTHEPCPLCLSAITWAGFDNFTYLFGYEDTRDAFAIPHDLKILEEVFGVKDGAYRHDQRLLERAARSPIWWRRRRRRSARDLSARMDGLAKTYAALSATYQAQKGDADIPLS